MLLEPGGVEGNRYSNADFLGNVENDQFTSIMKKMGVALDWIRLRLRIQEDNTFKEELSSPRDQVFIFAKTGI
jgi:hypothetical protein